MKVALSRLSNGSELDVNQGYNYEEDVDRSVNASESRSRKGRKNSIFDIQPFKSDACFKGKLNKASSRIWNGLTAASTPKNDTIPCVFGVSGDRDEKVKLISKYRRLAPATMHRQLSVALGRSQVLQPESEVIFAAVLLANIYCFTRLSSRLTADQLKHHINAYFSILLGIVKKNGGDAVKFLGDAVLIIFPVEYSSHDEIKAAAVLMASLCALQLTKECGLYDRGEGVNRVCLSLHCAIGCGIINCMILGEHQTWEFLVAGTPLQQIDEGISNASKGEVCLSAEAFDYVQDKLEVRRTTTTSTCCILTGRRATLFKSRQNDSHHSAAAMTHAKSKGTKQAQDLVIVDINIEKDVELAPSAPRSGKVAIEAYEGKRPVSGLKKPKSTKGWTAPGLTRTTSAMEADIKPLGLVGKLFSYLDTDHDHDHDHDPFRLLENCPAVDEVRSFLEGFLIPDVEAVQPPVNSELTFTIERTTRNYRTSNVRERDLVLSDPYLYSVLSYFSHDTASASFEGAGASYLFEIRNVTTLFVEFLGLDHDFISGDVTRPQKALVACLGSVQMFGGTVLLFTVDDKGVILIGAFGLPGSSHEDDCCRAVEAAMNIRVSLGHEGINCKQGIAEGRVFCGLVGNRSRCDYTILGSSVNLAARLMGKCKSGEILVNETAYESSKSAFVYLELPKVKAKGYSKPVSVYKPVERTYSHEILGGSSSGAVAFVGRQTELATVTDALRNCTERPHRIIVDGPPSVGKTRLVAEALRIVSMDPELKLNPIVSAGSSATHLSGKYQTLRPILDQIFQLKKDEAVRKYSQVLRSQKLRGLLSFRLDSASDYCASLPSERNGFSSIRDWIAENVSNHLIQIRLKIEKVESIGELAAASGEALYANYNMLDLVPLLGDIMGIKGPDTKVTLTLDGRVRYQIIDEMILRCMMSESTSSTRVIIVDNLQWCDLASLRILASYVQSLKSGIFIGLTRPIDEMHLMDGNDHLMESMRRQKRMVALANLCCHLKIKQLSLADVVTIIENTIGPVLALARPEVFTPANLRSISDRANGSPLHVFALAAALKRSLDAGISKDLEDLPDPSDNLIISRYDTLVPRNQVTVKAASVIGMTFSTDELKTVLTTMGMQESIDVLDSTMQHLIDTNLIERAGPDSFKFVSRSIQRGIYNLMLASHRETVHGIMGDYYEHRYLSDEDHFQEVVHHYALSNKLSKKCFYLQRLADTQVQGHCYPQLNKTYETLVNLATGCDCRQLLSNGLAMKETKPRTCTDVFMRAVRSSTKRLSESTISRKGDLNLTDSLHISKRWLLWSEFQDKVYINHDNGGHWTQSRVMGWLAALAQTQFSLGNFTYSNNMAQLCAYNFRVFPTLEMRVSASKSLFSRLNSNLSMVPRTLSQMLTALEYVIIINLMRGLGEQAVVVSNRLSEIMNELVTKANANEIEASCAMVRLIRVNTLQGLAMISLSSNEHEYNRAIAYLLQISQYNPENSYEIIQPDIRLKMAVGIYYLSIGEIVEARNIFDTSATQCIESGDRGTMSLCLLGKSWSSFLAGRVEETKSAVSSVLAFASGANHVPMYVWALELQVLVKSFVGDFQSADEDLRLICSLEKKDKSRRVQSDWPAMEEAYSATTCAVVAFSMTLRKNYDSALPYAVYACKMLSSRNQGSALGGFLLFFAVYAVLDVYETKRKDERVNVLSQKCSKPRASVLGTMFNSKMASVAESSVLVRLMAVVSDALKALNQHAQKFVCLCPMALVISLRMRRLEGADVDLLMDLDDSIEELDEISHENIFASAYIHLQRAIFCDLVGASFECRGAGDSRVLAKKFFALYHSLPDELILLGVVDVEDELIDFASRYAIPDSASSVCDKESVADHSDSSVSGSSMAFSRRASAWIASLSRGGSIMPSFSRGFHPSSMLPWKLSSPSILPRKFSAPMAKPRKYSSHTTKPRKFSSPTDARRKYSSPALKPRKYSSPVKLLKNSDR